MRFITEEDLRQEYRKNRFTEYAVKEGTRLTPGGRQFLSDYGIRLITEDHPQQSKVQPVPMEQRKDSPMVVPQLMEQWQLKLKTLQADFLQTGAVLLELDSKTAKEVLELERYLAAIGQPDMKKDWNHLCASCTGITPETSGILMEDCFEVTGAQLQLPGGKTLIQLHLLRCRLRELESILPIDKKGMAHRLINKLSQMICHLSGGKVCHKK